MEWHNHSREVLEGEHAFLGASKYAWLNYDEDKLVQVWRNHQAIELGTRKHALAAELIRMNQKLKATRQTFNMYVNDAIGFRMTPELVLYYSENCFGTADAISFNKNFLRIHDLKTGANPASFHQLEIYAGLFCLEYNVDPDGIEIQLRIYQNDEVKVGEPTSVVIKSVMDKKVASDRIIRKLKEGQADCA